MKSFNLITYLKNKFTKCRNKGQIKWNLINYLQINLFITVNCLAPIQISLDNTFKLTEQNLYLAQFY